MFLRAEKVPHSQHLVIMVISLVLLQKAHKPQNCLSDDTLF